MDIRKRIIESAVEIFTTMVMMDIHPLEEEAAKSGSLKDSISGLIGLAGTHKGVLAIHLPKKVALAITGSFLGMEVDEINEDVEDAVGEIANMLGGNVKTILSENGRDIDLSLPSTISGRDYDFQPTKEAERTIIPFAAEHGNFLIELQLEK